jgi:cyclin H
MTEDDLYRTSTQYRLWSFTPEKLASLRYNTNALASEHVKAAIKRHKHAKSQLPSFDVSATTSAATSDAENNGVSNGAGGPVRAPENGEVDCLTAEEEKKLIDFYCSSCLQMSLSEPFNLPIYVVVCYETAYRSQGQFETDITPGHCDPVLEAVLPFQLPNDLPTKEDYAVGFIPGH